MTTEHLSGSICGWRTLFEEEENEGKWHMGDRIRNYRDSYNCKEGCNRVQPYWIFEISESVCPGTNNRMFFL